jgi:hypothetical protein
MSNASIQDEKRAATTCVGLVVARNQAWARSGPGTANDVYLREACRHIPVAWWSWPIALLGYDDEPAPVLPHTKQVPQWLFVGDFQRTFPLERAWQQSGPLPPPLSRRYFVWLQDELEPIMSDRNREALERVDWGAVEGLRWGGGPGSTIKRWVGLLDGRRYRWR